MQSDKVVAAYQRSDLLDIRKLIMAAWNSYLNGRDNVVELVRELSLCSTSRTSS